MDGLLRMEKNVVGSRKKSIVGRQKGFANVCIRQELH